MEKIIDLTQTITDNLPAFPGDPETRLSQISRLETEGHNNFRLETGMHSGTHIDGPMHLTESREYIAELPLERFTGPGCLLEAEGQEEINLRPEYRERVSAGCIVLIHTGQDRLYGKAEYFTGYPVISLELAEFLVSREIKMVGLDSPSPDVFPYPVHKMLLSRGILVIENLTGLERLRGVREFEVTAWPLKAMADGSPARVAARVRE